MKYLKKSDGGRKWYMQIPNPVVLLFLIIIIATFLSHILPAGKYDREIVDGRQIVIPDTYHTIAPNPLGLMDMFKAIPLGFRTAIDIIFVVLASGIMFGILEKSKMIENAVGTFVRKLGQEKKFFIVALMTFLYGGLGVIVGYENNIAMVPIAAVTSLALGGDLMLAAAIAVGGITVGFGLSPVNPYTVGTGHKIAQMPLYSGALLRSLVCFTGLSTLAYFNVKYFKSIINNKEKSLTKEINTAGFALSKPIADYSISNNNKVVMMIFGGGLLIMLYGIFKFHWYINEISSIFLMITILSGIAAGMSGKTISETALTSVSVVAPGAFMVGLATSIKVILEQGSINDTIAFQLSGMLQGFSVYTSALGMSLIQSVINFLIPSGSGQALATLPIMIPAGEVLGLTRQTTILAFQIGDGVTNLVNPTLGGLIAMLSLCRVPFDKWLQYITPIVGLILIFSWLFLLFSVYIDWGPV